MKVYQTSDVHLEFGDFNLSNKDNAEVLVLGGDIIVADRLERHDPTVKGATMSRMFHSFFQRASELFPHVIYIMGNHEHYQGDFARTESHLRERLSIYPNVHILERQTLKIEDVTFVGGTMWTDCNNSDPQTLMQLKHALNDFRIVKNSNTPKIVKSVPIYKMNDNGTYVKSENGSLVVERMARQENVANFSSEDSVLEHDKFLAYLRSVVEGKHNEKFFVCTHHAPSRLSTHERFKHEHLMNGGFSTELFDFIADTPQIKVWTHGHTHDPFDYTIGETRIVCNPRGYIGHESKAVEYEAKLIEV